MKNNPNTTIHRAEKDRDRPYRAIRRATLEDDRLSFEARGVLAYILVKPDDWSVQVVDLMKQGGMGRDRTYRILNELIAAGYVQRIELREHGRIIGYQYLVYEEPLTEKPQTALPLPEKPYTAKPYTAEPYTENPDHTKEEVFTKQENSTKKETPQKRKERKRSAPLIPLPPTVEEEMDAKICEVLGRDQATMNQRDKKPIEEARKLFLAAGYKPSSLDTFWEAWQQDWRYRRDRSRPSLKVLREELGRIKLTLPDAKLEGASTNGKNSHYDEWATWQPDDLAGAGLPEVR